jgi:hypothetical protein
MGKVHAPWGGVTATVQGLGKSMDPRTFATPAATTGKTTIYLNTLT